VHADPKFALPGFVFVPSFAMMIAPSYYSTEGISEGPMFGECFHWMEQRRYIVHLIHHCFSEIQDYAKHREKKRKIEQVVG